MFAAILLVSTSCVLSSPPCFVDPDVARDYEVRHRALHPANRSGLPDPEAIEAQKKVKDQEDAAPVVILRPGEARPHVFVK